MRQRINKNLIGSSELDSSSAKIAKYNKTFMAKSESTEKQKTIYYITFFGKEYVIGKDITMDEVKKANLSIKSKIL